MRKDSTSVLQYKIFKLISPSHLCYSEYREFCAITGTYWAKYLTDIFFTLTLTSLSNVYLLAFC